jgi:hypothetical protein
MIGGWLFNRLTNPKVRPKQRSSRIKGGGVHICLFTTYTCVKVRQVLVGDGWCVWSEAVGNAETTTTPFARQEKALEISLLLLKTIDPEAQEVGMFRSFTEDLPVCWYKRYWV